MANLQFLRGTQEKLNAITSGNKVQDGAFYLTTDTNRLYVGQGTDLVELNKSVTTVAKLADLPKNTRKDNNGTTGEIVTRKIEEGQFYYVKDINVLCVYSEGKDGNGRVTDQWTQINPDTKLTNVDSTITEITPTASDNFDTAVSIQDSFTQKLPGDVATSAITNTNKIQTKNLKVEKVDDDTILFTGDTYAISTKAVTDTGHTEENPKYKSKEVNIDLTRTIASNNESADDTEKTSVDTIVIKGNEGIQSISSSGNVITIKPTTIQSMDNKGNQSGLITISTQETEGGTKTQTSLKPIIRYGSTTEKKDVVKQSISNGELQYDNEGKPILITTPDVDVKVAEETFDFFVDADGIKNYEMNLDVYTTSEVNAIRDNLEESIKDHIRANNAMTFKGTITSFSSVDNSLPKISDNVAVGDTWMLSIGEPVVLGSITYKSGDIFIATGTESTTGDNEGYIASNLTWNYVPAGNDTYIAKWDWSSTKQIVDGEEVDVFTGTKAFQIVDGQNSSNIIGSVNAKASGNIEVSVSNTGTVTSPRIEYAFNHKALTDAIKANHAVTAKETQTAAGPSQVAQTTDIHVVDALSVDGDGHVIAWKDKTVTLTDTHNRLDANNSSLTITPATADGDKDKRVKMSSKVAMADGDSITQTYDIKSAATNINISGDDTAGSKNIQFSLVWGEF